MEKAVLEPLRMLEALCKTARAEEVAAQLG